MRFLSILLLPALAAATAVAPRTACVTDTLDNYIKLGSTGCQVGPLGVVDFVFTPLLGNNVTILASDVTVSPKAPGPGYSLDITSPKFTASGAEVVKYLIGYTWDPGDIRSLDDILNDPPTPPGFSSVTTVACLDAAFRGNICPTSTITLSVFDGIGVQLTALASFSPPVSTLGIRNTFDIEGGGADAGGSATIISFGNQSTVPEPATALTCLAALALLRRWRSSASRARG